MHSLPKHVALVPQTAALFGAHHYTNKAVTNVLVQNEQLTKSYENLAVGAGLAVLGYHFEKLVDLVVDPIAGFRRTCLALRSLWRTTITRVTGFEMFGLRWVISSAESIGCLSVLVLLSEILPVRFHTTNGGILFDLSW